MTTIDYSPPPGAIWDHLDNPIAGPSTQVYAPVPARAVPPLASIASPSSPSKRGVISRPSTPSRPPSRTERKFKCEYPGCDKAYFKPARLREHELSHTGERPHVCAECGQSYLRATHLAAHTRTHKSAEERSYHCSRDGCDKSFWTATHLKRHEKMHDEAISYKCELCDESFHKTHQLREHTALAHMPAGTKPFVCTHPGCGASFAMKAHLKAHGKTHDTSRYTCSDPSHTDTFPIFPTWTALQAHMKEVHPPTCHFPECESRIFNSKQSLKHHLKVHAQREADLDDRAREDEEKEEAGLEDLMSLEKIRPKRPRASGAQEEGAGSEEKAPKKAKLAKIHGGEAGKDVPCPEPTCTKRFKTQYAAKSHHESAHLHPLSYKCKRPECDAAFEKFGDLKRHIAAEHPVSPVPAPSLPVDTDGEKLEAEENVQASQEDKPYEVWKTWDVERRAFACPAHKTGVVDGDCAARFTRVYDVRRHLTAEHMLELGDEDVRRLLLGGAEDFLVDAETS